MRVEREVDPQEFFDECSVAEAKELLDICLDGLSRKDVYRKVVDWIQSVNMDAEAIEDLGGITKE